MSIHDAEYLIEMHGTIRLNEMRLIMHNNSDRGYSKGYILDTKIFRSFMTFVEE